MIACWTGTIGQGGVQGTLSRIVRSMATDGRWCVMLRWLRWQLARRVGIVGLDGVRDALSGVGRGMVTDVR